MSRTRASRDAMNGDSPRAKEPRVSGLTPQSEAVPDQGWAGLRLPDEVLLSIVKHLGDTITLEERSKCPLLRLSQVSSRLRLLVHGHAVRCVIKQPHLSRTPALSLKALPLASYRAVVTLDLGWCLDWVQHPSLRALSDLAALAAMPQLRALLLRPPFDSISETASGRIKRDTGVLCWANGIMSRIWDRWIYGHFPNMGSLHNVSALTALTALEALAYPITVRAGEDIGARTACVPSLSRLRSLQLGHANVTDASLRHIATATRLTELSIGNCAAVTTAGFHTLAVSLHRLVRLALFACTEMRVTDKGWAYLYWLSALRDLTLCGPPEDENVHFLGAVAAHNSPLPLSSEAFAGLCHLTRLDRLALSGLSDPGGALHLRLRGLGRLTALSHLELASCLAAPAAVLPGLLDSLTALTALHLRAICKDEATLPGLAALSRLTALRILSLDTVGGQSMEAEEVPEAATVAQPLAAIQALAPVLEALLLWRPNAAWLAAPASGIPAERLAALTRLTRLSIAGSPATQFGDADMRLLAARLARLHTLEAFECTHVTDAGLAAIGAGLTRLENLDLFQTPLVGDAGIAALRGLSRLQTLRLMASGIGDAGIAVAAGWPRLRNLSLKAAQHVTDAGVRHLVACSALKILDLAECSGLTDEGLTALADMRELRQLNLERCRRITNGGIVRFKRRVMCSGPGDGPDAGSLIVFF